MTMAFIKETYVTICLYTYILYIAVYIEINFLVQCNI